MPRFRRSAILSCSELVGFRIHQDRHRPPVRPRRCRQLRQRLQNFFRLQQSALHWPPRRSAAQPRRDGSPDTDCSNACSLAGMEYFAGSAAAIACSRVDRIRRAAGAFCREQPQSKAHDKTNTRTGCEAGLGTPPRSREKTHRTTTGTSVFTAQTSATTHPIIVQPRKKFSSTIAVDVPLAARQSNDRRQKIHHEPKAEKRQEKTQARGAS